MATNRRAENCRTCGQVCEAGQGALSWEIDDDDERKVWYVLCLDQTACAARVQAERDERERARVAAKAHQTALRALEQRFHAGERPEGTWTLVGEEVLLSNPDSRIYGGGIWAVIEPEGDRIAPDPEEIARVSADHGARIAALKAAQAGLVAWTIKHLPAHSSYRRCNPKSFPHDGQWFTSDLALMSPSERVEYDALLQAVQHLSYTSSTGSYHAAADRLRALEQAAALATYPRSIWYVVNNGHDGDDWSANNVRTGGAGAVGWRLPWSAELEASVRALCVHGRGAASNLSGVVRCD
jgi:hypothetical protein